ncbi:TonB-dependent receptor [Robertkochia aurantiaca]|uniref:TonB-dependent receptor n=1 Tax=Robertkochia aurantiaca TaxID=2873700 RepID=UPI001CCC41E0|nr:carboxypeptidase-like regulatory domain-containing protein [Robertkochia sp. 3YJGBD-33]
MPTRFGSGVFLISRVSSSLIFCLFFFMVSNAQEPASLTVDLDDSTLLDVILELEKQSGYHFFFSETWIGDKKNTLTLYNVTLTEALDQALNETDLNYYILENEKRVILLQNAVIYDELPNNFFVQGDTLIPSAQLADTGYNRSPPVLLENSTDSSTRYSLVRIGKAEVGQFRSVFTLSGKATNVSTGKPVPDLLIRVQGSNKTTLTDQEGVYALELPPGYHVLLVSALGLEEMEREIILYNDGTLDLKMKEGLEELEEVVVEAKTLRTIENTDTGSEKIVLEESKNIPLVLGERDILQLAKALPGISSAGEGATGLNVRGGKTDQNLVLLDNAVIYNPTHFFGIFQALNPFTTESAEIYKASIPVEFGGRLSSVFDIQTLNGNTNEFEGEASIGPVTANLALQIPVVKEKSSLVVGGRGAYADWILRTLDDESLNNSEASFYDGIVKYHHKLNDNNEIQATAYLSKDDFSITQDSLYNYSNRLATLKWNHRYSENTAATLSLTYSGYRFGIDYDGEGNSDFDLNYDIDETSFVYKLFSQVGKSHRVDYGISTKFYSVNPGSIEPAGEESEVSPVVIEKEQAIEGALFIGDEFDLSDRLQLSVGLRYAFFAAAGPSTQRTYQEGSPTNEGTVADTLSFGSGDLYKTYGGPEVRLSVRYLLDEDFSVKAGFNNAFQFIHTLSNNTTVSPIDTWKLSDLNIKPQTGYQATLGIYKLFGDHRYELSLEGYYKRMDNVLDFKTGANLFLNENVETQVLQGRGKAYGVEFLLKKNTGRLNGWFGYTYSRSFYRFDSEFSEERINDGEYFPSNFDKPHDLSIIANYRLTRRFSFSGNFVYQTGRPVTYPVGTFRFNNADYVAFSDRNQFRIPDFYRLDLGVNIEGNHRKNKLAHSFWSISVYNVLGRNNPYSVFFVTENGEIKALQSSIFAVPIPSITYNIKF